MNDFALQTEEPGIGYQIWMRLKKEPKLASSLTVAKLAALTEFSHVAKNVVSAAVSDLCNVRGVLAKIGKVGREFVYGPGPNWDAPQSFGKRVIGKTLKREKGYKQRAPERPVFGLQHTLGLDPDRARDQTRERQLRVARALPLDVLEQAIVEKRRAAAVQKTAVNGD